MSACLTGSIELGRDYKDYEPLLETRAIFLLGAELCEYLISFELLQVQLTIKKDTDSQYLR